MKYLLLLITLTSCLPQSRWIESNVKEGRHDFDLDFYKGYTYLDTIRINVRFTDSTKYELCCGDQWDWNKGMGIMTRPHPHQGNATIGWRYNPNTGMFEVGYYVHDLDKNTTHMGGSYAIAVYPDEEFWYEIIATDTAWFYRFSNGARYEIEKTFNTPPLKKVGGWWFGGNQSAPKDLTLYWYW